MKHFIVTLVLNAPRTEIGSRRLVLHDRHFHTGYELGLFLFYGPLCQADGYLAVARSESSQTLNNFLEEDPLVREHLASVAVQEYTPSKFPETMRGWVHPLGLGNGSDLDWSPSVFI